MSEKSSRSGMRMSADERRRSIIVAAMTEFAQTGFAGTSTEDIARRAGISQPYLFRLFGTKRDLFLAAVETAFDRVRHNFAAASEGLEGKEALLEMGRSYEALLGDDELLRLQLHAYAASGDPTIRAAVAARFAGLAQFVAERTGVSAEEVRDFFAIGMLLNVAAALELSAIDGMWAGVICLPGSLVGTPGTTSTA